MCLFACGFGGKAFCYNHFDMKKIMVVVFLCLGAVLIILSFSELEDIIATLQHANPWYLTLALGIQLAWFAVLGLTFKSIYRVLGLKESMRRLTFVAIVGGFVNVVAPSAGLGGMAIFINDGHDRGQPSGKVTVAGALYFLLDEAAFLCVLALAMIILARRGNLSAGEIAAALLLFLMACVIAFLLYLGYRSEEALGNVLAKMARLVNHAVRPFISREYLSEARAHKFASEVAEGLASVPEKFRSLIQPFLLSLLNKSLLMLILLAAFLSFDVPFTAGTIIGGFAIAYLFLIVSPTPSGIGVVEGVMALALRSLRVDFSQAVVITLAYRAVTFWIPLAVGALAFRALQLSGAKKEACKNAGKKLA